MQGTSGEGTDRTGCMLIRTRQSAEGGEREATPAPKSIFTKMRECRACA